MSRARDKANSTVSNFASTGIDDNADATAITIDSSENVGIGVTSMSAKTVINQPSSSDALIIQRAAGVSGNTTFSFPSANSQIAGTNHIILSAGGSERLRIRDSGGITFNGDTAAANALDDYEEGTFTPTFTGASTAGSITYVVQDGRYVKIGKQVTLWIRFQYSAFSGSAGTIRVGGFPYASESGTHAHGLSSNWLSFGNPIPSGWPIFYISGGTSHANALISKDNTSWADWASSDFHLTSGNKYFNLNIFYKTA